MQIKMGHSPDSDDEFMFWALSSGKIISPMNFVHVLKDIQTLNEWALEGYLECTGMSAQALAHVSDKYTLIRQGASFGENYGPIIVAKNNISPKDLAFSSIAIPGTLTSAYLGLNLYFHDVFGDKYDPIYKVMEFDRIMEAVASGSVDAGLLIHEGQLSYQNKKLFKLLDLGSWWYTNTGLPLPLGVTAVKTDLGEENIDLLSRDIYRSIRFGLEHQSEAFQFARKAAKDLDKTNSQQYIDMYVNNRTLDMGDDGIDSIKLFLKMGADLGLLPKCEISVHNTNHNITEKTLSGAHK